MQDKTALPDPATLVGETPHDVLFVARFTILPKPLTEVIVIVETPVAFAFTLTLVGFAVMEKS